MSPWHVPSICQGCACRVCLWEIVLMLDRCSRVSCLHKEPLVYVPSALQCQAEGWESLSSEESREGCAASFTGWGRQGWGTELAGRGAPGYLLLPWGRSNSYPSPVLFFKEGDARADLPCLHPRLHIPHLSFSCPVLGYPYTPMQTLSPGLPRNPLDTNPTTATTVVCQSPVLTLFFPALKVTAEETERGRQSPLPRRLPHCIPLAPTWGAGL